MKTLDELAIEHQTDRATVFNRTYAKPHGYAPHYDRVLSPIRLDPVKLLEIGVGGGEGVRMWLDYFSNGSQIYGVDNQRDTNPWDTPGKRGRYTFCQGDQSCATFWACFIADYGKEWDIIIDDGSHRNDHIITTFQSLWQYIKPGGFYCIEDLGVGYGAGSVFVKDGFPSHMEFVKNQLDNINWSGYDIDYMQFSKELCVMRKK